MHALSEALSRSEFPRAVLVHLLPEPKKAANGAFSARPLLITGDLFREDTESEETARGSRQAQTLERGASRSSIDVRHNNQFENPDIGEFNSIFLDLAYRGQVG